MLFDNIVDRLFSQDIKFSVYEWEIWHTYSSFFIDRFYDLSASAEAIINSGFAEYVTLSTGLSFWRSKNGIQRGKNIIKLDTSGTKAEINLKADNNVDIDASDYALECWKIGSHLRQSELRLFKSERPFAAPYLRAFLSPIKFINDTYGLVECYPIITLHENGIILIQLRTIGPNYSVTIEELIDNYVNLYKMNFDRVDTQPTIERLLPLVYDLYSSDSLSFIERAKLLWKKSIHNRIIDERTERDISGEFEFELITLGIEDEEITITSMSQTLFYIMGFLASIPRNPLKFLLLGSQNLPKLGDFWNGRPHIHIIRHSRQADKASKNEKIHSKNFSRILARVSNETRSGSSLSLPKSARPFEDYGVYINSALTLWVWSKDGLKKNKGCEDINRDHFVYEHEAQVGFLEYGHMLYRSLVDQSDSMSNRKNIFQMKKDLARLEVYTAEISPYGELRNLLNSGWQTMGVNLLKQQLQENLTILEMDVTLTESEKRERFQNFLTLIFGILAVPIFASEVIAPLWNILGLWQPQGSNEAKLFFVIIAGLIVIMIIVLFKRRKNPSDFIESQD